MNNTDARFSAKGGSASGGHGHDNFGFTLIEITAAVVIVGVLATIALPSFNTAVERVRSSEGVQILNALYGAQRRYFHENAQTYATAITALDITIPASNNFDVVNILIQNDPTALAVINRFGSYTLSINDQGAIACADASGPSGICAKMGY